MKKLHLADGYSFAGYIPYRSFEQLSGFQDNRLIKLKRVQKKQDALAAENFIELIMTRKSSIFAIFHAGIWKYILSLNTDALNAKRRGV